MNEINGSINEKFRFFNEKEADELSFKLAEYAQKAILYEAILTPKAGLVDCIDVGAHKDMNIFTFVNSSSSLYRGFYNYSKAGLLWELDLKELFKEARKIGIDVEKDMFVATRNVNTHKGINFSLGIALIATGYYINTSKKLDISNFSQKYTQNTVGDIKNYVFSFDKNDIHNILEIIKDMVEGLVERDFKDLDKKKFLTNGERLYIETGFSGIRGEVEKGFPTVMEIALPRLRFLSHMDISMERKLLDVLFHIMSVSDDSNIVFRGGLESLDFVKEQATKFIEDGGVFNDNYKQKIEQMNTVFVEKNLSPGGAADLLSLALFFAFLENLI